MCGLYGDIFDDDGITITRTWLQEIRRVSGNMRPEVVSDTDIEAARISASEETERATRRENINPETETELYNLMSKASNYSASVQIMAPFNDKQEIRKLNIMEFARITKLIQDVESPTDTTIDTSAPIVGSEYGTGSLATDGVGDGMWLTTKYGHMQW
jgi:hypothetical protein